MNFVILSKSSKTKFMCKTNFSKIRKKNELHVKFRDENNTLT